MSYNISRQRNKKYRKKSKKKNNKINKLSKNSNNIMSYNISRQRNKKYGKKSKKNNNKINKSGGNQPIIDYDTILNIGDVLSETKQTKIINKSSCIEYLFDILNLEEELQSNWQNTVDADGHNIWINMKTNKILNQSPIINTRNILENLILELDNNTNKTLPYSLIFFMSQFIDNSKVDSSLQSKINLVKTFFTNKIDYFQNLLFNKYLKSHHFYNNNKINNFTLHNDMNNYNDVYTKSYSNATTIKTLLKTLLNYSKTNSNMYLHNEIVYNNRNNYNYKISGIIRNVYSEFITYNFIKRSSIQKIKETINKLILIYSHMPSLYNTKAHTLLDGKKFNLSEMDLENLETDILIKIDYNYVHYNRNFIYKKWNLNVDTIGHELDFTVSNSFLDSLLYTPSVDNLYLTTLNTEPTDKEIYTFIETNKKQINDMILKNKEIFDMNTYIKKNENFNSKQSKLLKNYKKYVNTESYITELLVKNKIINDNNELNEYFLDIDMNKFSEDQLINPIDNVLLPLYDINDTNISTKISGMSEINKDIIKKHILNQSNKSTARMTIYKQKLNDTYKIDLLQMVEVFNDLTDDTLKNLGYTTTQITDIKWYLSITLDYNKRKIPTPILDKEKFAEFKFSFFEYYTSKSTTIENKMKLMYIDFFKKEETNYINKTFSNYQNYCIGVDNYNELNYKQAFLVFNYLYNLPAEKPMKVKCSLYLYNIYIQEFFYHQDCKQLHHETKAINKNCTYYIDYIKDNIYNIETYIINLKHNINNYINFEQLLLLNDYKDEKTKAELELLGLQKKYKSKKSITPQSELEIKSAEQKLININEQISVVISDINNDKTKINETDSIDILLLALYRLFVEQPITNYKEFLNKLRLSNNYDRLLFLKFLHLFNNDSMMTKFHEAEILIHLKQFLDEQLLFVKPNEEIIYSQFDEQHKNVNILLYRKINFALFFIHKFQNNYHKCNENQIEITIYSFFIPAELCIMYLDRDILPIKDKNGSSVDKFIKIDSIIQYKSDINIRLLERSTDEFIDKTYFKINLPENETREIDYNHAYSFDHIDPYPPKCNERVCPCRVPSLLSNFQYICSKQYYDNYYPNALYTLINRSIQGPEQTIIVIDDSYMDLISFKEQNIELIRPSYNIKISDEDKRDNINITIDFNDKDYQYITEENISKLYLFKIFNDFNNYCYNFSPRSKINVFEYDILDNFFLDMFSQELQNSKYIIQFLKKMNFDKDKIDTIVHMYSNITDSKTQQINKFLTISLNEPVWKYVYEHDEIYFSPSISSRIQDAYLEKKTNFKLIDVNLEFDLTLNIVYKMPDNRSNSLRVLNDTNMLNTAIGINNDVKYRKFKLIQNLLDGNCLFHSLSEVLKKDFNIIRFEIANFVKTHYNDRINSLSTNVNTTYSELILMKNNSQPITMDEYFNHMNTPKTWGTDIEIMAACELYKINIYIINSIGLNMDQYYIGNKDNTLHNNVIYLYNDNLIHYRLAIIESFNIRQSIMNDTTQILDISRIDFDTLSNGEKCAFITLLSKEYITILRMLEIKDVTKSIRVHGKKRVFIKVSDYITNLKNVFEKFVIDYRETFLDDQVREMNKEKREEDILSIIIDMKSLIISTFDNESLAYFIILHCFLFNLYNPPPPSEQSETYKDYMLWYKDSTAYSFHTFLNSKINDSNILVSEFIQKNDLNLDNLKRICKNSNTTNLDKSKSVVDEPKSWTFWILNLLYLGSDLYKAIHPRMIEIEPKFIRERAAKQIAKQLPLIEAKKILGLDSDANWKSIKEAYHALSIKFHPDKTQNSKEDTNKLLLIQNAYFLLENAHKQLIFDQVENNPAEAAAAAAAAEAAAASAEAEESMGMDDDFWDKMVENQENNVFV